MIKEITITTNKREEIVDISSEVEKALKESKTKEGLLTIYVKHATAAIAINENYDPNVGLDLLKFLKDKIPRQGWLHSCVDNNADAHLKSAVMDPNEVIPIKDGKLQLGTWQSPILCEFDGPKTRTIIIQILG